MESGTSAVFSGLGKRFGDEYCFNRIRKKYEKVLLRLRPKGEQRCRYNARRQNWKVGTEGEKKPFRVPVPRRCEIPR